MPYKIIFLFSCKLFLGLHKGYFKNNKGYAYNLKKALNKSCDIFSLESSFKTVSYYKDKMLSLKDRVLYK